MTSDELNDAVNAGADLVLEDLELFATEYSLSIACRSLVDLVVNAQVYLHPGATLDEVIAAEYSRSPEEVRSWMPG
jgi:hypothetical protein